MNCFHSIPFNTTIRDQTLDVLSKAYELYTFLDIATQPPNIDHFYPAVDLLSDFKKMRNQSFTDDFAFQYQLAKIFQQLHDAHTNYYLPQSYSSFAFYQPFNLIAYVNNNNEHVVSVSQWFISQVQSYYQNEFGIDVEQFVGAQIVEINGNPAIQELKEYSSKHVGLAKDPSVRFNIALCLVGPYPDFYFGSEGPWLGLYTSRPSHFMPAPQEQSISYKVRFTNGTIKTFTFDWVGVSSRSYENMEDYHSAYLNPHPYQSQPILELEKEASLTSRVQHHPIDLRVVRLGKNFVDFTPDQTIIPIVNTTKGGAGAYQVGSDTLVWYMNTFEPEDYFTFQATAIDAFVWAQLNNLHQLIIDNTANGGGDICLGRQMLKWIESDHTNFGPTDMPSSPLARNLTETAVKFDITETEWSPSFYQNQENRQFPQNSTSWLIPGIEHVRGGHARNYSQLIHISSRSQDCGNFPFDNNVRFSPRKIIIATKGWCGSTCALFSNHLANYEHVKTLSSGGFPQVAQQYTSFPGLEVLDSGGLYQILNTLKQETGDLGCSSCSAPRNLLTSAAYRLCIREIYGPDNLNQPLEYTWQPADFHHNLDEHTAQQGQLIWPQIVKYFNQPGLWSD
eukprot:CAMPEP_0201545506 /NCGR_PEP_ID=MMETSP0173_2-20130828/2002_1 /ASSEMBLY_ACC=CAM_ASM_000268 /TAXON_ID=218659 /ORGANISM="Vexillifera sp., Strain DIVA3 564/2" /LENGTH=619 /DNA_ID=CAMNT_0047953921 /DNA_START=154 /DNA_END=2013 /DNA_ORIENTATION=-